MKILLARNSWFFADSDNNIVGRMKVVLSKLDEAAAEELGEAVKTALKDAIRNPPVEFVFETGELLNWEDIYLRPHEAAFQAGLRGDLTHLKKIRHGTERRQPPSDDMARFYSAMDSALQKAFPNIKEDDK